ncbi:MAG TPA: hypothetical protein VLW26_05065 [Steroidobacteraceae bacterium]|nr:hypothetical protein [Steroidobacteraceae bacterium]
MKALSCVLMLTALAGSQAYAGCTYPKAPEKIPDGSTATMQEMLDGQQAVKAYNGQIKEYQDCLADELKQSIAKADADKATKEQKEQLEKMADQKINAAQDEVEALTARFNEQIRVFKAKTAKPAS